MACDDNDGNCDFSAVVKIFTKPIPVCLCLSVRHLLLRSTDITTMSERIAFNCFKMPPVIESSAIVHEEKVSRDCLYYCIPIHLFIYLKVFFMIAEKALFITHY
jgi:hypothetical protein